MKTIKHLLLLLALISVQAVAQDSQFRLWMDESATATADGTTVTYLTVSQYDPDLNYLGFNMELKLPKGFRINQKKSGREYVNDITLSEDRATSTHSISCNMPDATTLKIACTSSQNQELYPDDVDGKIVYPLFTVGLVADPATINGTYEIVMSGISFTWRGEDNTLPQKVIDKLDEVCILTVSGGTDLSAVNCEVDATGYATLYYGDRALEVPAGVEAMTYKVNGDGSLAISRQYVFGDLIPAGEGVVIKAEQGIYSFNSKVVPTKKDPENMLKGTDEEAMTVGQGRHYALSLNAGLDPSSVGFYWMAEDGAPFMNAAHKAYLVLDRGLQASSVLRLNGLTTALDRVYAGDAEDERQYAPNGVRVGTDYKGLVIKNGKKQIIK